MLSSSKSYLVLYKLVADWRCSADMRFVDSLAVVEVVVAVVVDAQLHLHNSCQEFVAEELVAAVIHRYLGAMDSCSRAMVVVLVDMVGNFEWFVVRAVLLDMVDNLGMTALDVDIDLGMYHFASLCPVLRECAILVHSTLDLTFCI